MKSNILKISLAAALLALFAGCSDWMEPESNIYDDCPLDQLKRDDAYYEALREYKASEHSVAFGWFSGWGEASANISSTLSAVPDSMDIISLWDNSRNLTPGKKEDLEFVQKVKGTKVIVCGFVHVIGQGYTPAEYNGSDQMREAFWGWDDGDEEAIHSAIAKYAKAISDTLGKYGYDGFDIDYETGGKLDKTRKYFDWFVEEMGHYFGPKSGTGRLFVIDGYVNTLSPHIVQYIDYFVSQAYSVSGGTPSASAGTTAADKDRRLSQCVTAFQEVLTEEQVTNMFIVTENVESAMDCLKGGFYWTDSQGRKWSKDVMPSMLGFASWEPANGFRKGGFGGYKFNNEAVSTTPYKWFRKGIQQQNPAPGSRIITDDDFVAAN
ncbi:MAG: glycoside hydrolase family 18 [Candidatus Cryptobacteroides sp.]